MSERERVSGEPYAPEDVTYSEMQRIAVKLKDDHELLEAFVRFQKDYVNIEQQLREARAIAPAQTPRGEASPGRERELADQLRSEAKKVSSESPLAVLLHNAADELDFRPAIRAFCAAPPAPSPGPEVSEEMVERYKAEKLAIARERFNAAGGVILTDSQADGVVRRLLTAALSAPGRPGGPG